MTNPNTENNQENQFNAPDPNQQPQQAQPQQEQPQYQQPQYQQQAQYQQPQYQQPQYQQPGQPKPADGKGQSIAALVLGCVGITFCWIGGLNFVVLVLSILGIVFGALGRKKSIAVHGKASGMATAGLVLGIIGTAFSAVGVVACVACVGCSSCASGCFEGVINSAYSEFTF